MFRSVFFLVGVLAVASSPVYGDLVFGVSNPVINGAGPDTASVRIFATATGNTLANAGSLELIGQSTVNVQIDLLGDLDFPGSSITVTPSALLAGYGVGSFSPPSAATINSGDAATFTVGGPSVALDTLLAGGSTVDLWDLAFNVGNFFEAGVDESQIVVTVVPGDAVSPTSLGRFGDDAAPFNADPYLVSLVGATETLSVSAVPEPSSFLFLGLAVAAGGVQRWKRRQTCEDQATTDTV